MSVQGEHVGGGYIPRPFHKEREDIFFCMKSSNGSISYDSLWSLFKLG